MDQELSVSPPPLQKEQHRTVGGSWKTFLDVFAVVAENTKLLVRGIVIAGLIAGAAAFSTLRVYTSVAYLGLLEEAVEEAAPTMMRSPVMLDAVLVKFPEYPQPNLTLGRRRDSLASKLSWNIARSPDARRESLFVLEVDDSETARAQLIATALLDAWLEAMRPRSDRRAQLAASLQSNETTLAELSEVVVNLLRQPGLLAPDPRSSYLPPNIGEVFRLHTETTARIAQLKAELSGGTRDWIFAPPSLPEIPSWPPRFFVVWMGAIVGFLTLCLYVLLRHAIAASPEASAKTRRIAAVLNLRRGGRGEG